MYAGGAGGVELDLELMTKTELELKATVCLWSDRRRPGRHDHVMVTGHRVTSTQAQLVSYVNKVRVRRTRHGGVAGRQRSSSRILTQARRVRACRSLA